MGNLYTSEEFIIKTKCMNDYYKNGPPPQVLLDNEQKYSLFELQDSIEDSCVECGDVLEKMHKCVVFDDENQDITNFQDIVLFNKNDLLTDFSGTCEPTTTSFGFFTNFSLKYVFLHTMATAYVIDEIEEKLKENNDEITDDDMNQLKKCKKSLQTTMYRYTKLNELLPSRKLENENTVWITDPKCDATKKWNYYRKNE